MHTLTIDIGNTNVKTVVWKEEEPVFQKSTPILEPALIEELVGSYSITDGVFSSVRGDDNEVEKVLKGLLTGKTIVVNYQTAEDFIKKSEYRMPIGSDRIAAYYGGEVMLPGVSKLIIDMGTAITIDSVSANGQHQGGDIILGLKGRLNGLFQNTARLPELKNIEWHVFPFGHDTYEAITNGAICGIVGEIKYAFERGVKNYKTEKIIITGGDSKNFMPLLKKEGLECVYDPYLVNRGLNNKLREVLSANPGF